jgi:hypothetical protein
MKDMPGFYTPFAVVLILHAGLFVPAFALQTVLLLLLLILLFL